MQKYLKFPVSLIDTLVTDCLLTPPQCLFSLQIKLDLCSFSFAYTTNATNTAKC